MRHAKSWLVPLLAAATSALVPGALVADEAPTLSVETLFAGSTTAIGQPLVYPPGEALVTSQIIILPPGAETGWHVHAVPLYGYILDGELTVDYGERGTHVYRTGDSLLEAVDWPHNGHNKGAVPVRILAVYIGAAGLADATKLPAQ
jgi:quercetin dioxygenase-like cupin family protein